MTFIINLLEFILALGLVVTIHELGHFSMAKLFGVYCQEFSIGFGPTLFKIKKGETQYSIRCVPLGGFVSMAGEGVDSETNPELDIPKERYLDGIARWKRAIIMLAGIIMNFVLAFVLFIGFFASTPQNDYSKRSVKVEETGLAYKAGLRSDDEIIKITYEGTISGESFTRTTDTIENGADLWNYGLVYKNDDFDYTPKTANDVMNLKFDILDKTPVTITIHSVANNEEYSWEKMGIGAVTRHLNFGEVMTSSVNEMGESSVAIIKAFGNIFSKEGFDSLGSPIAIFQVSSQAANLGFGYFILLWGLISVNLAIFNLLPFPGLDGWHFVVIIVESITRKEFPQKVKNIMSTIGMVLLFTLMIVITFKDVIKLIIK